MNNRIFLVCLAALLVAHPIGTRAGDRPEASIDVFVTFDYPDAITTSPGEIDGNGDVAGSFTDINGLQRGFVRYRNGHFTPSIVPRFGVGSFTGADDVNDARTICGFFSSADDTTFHGYFYSGGWFTQFDIAGATSTFVGGLNDAGEFVGSFSTDSSSSQSYIDLGGAVILFSVPGASFTNATSINEEGEAAGNYRVGTETTNHGFLRDEAGNLTYPIDVPGALGFLGTVVRGVNDRGWVVGGYFDQNSVEHGFLYRGPGKYLFFDYPDSLSTRLSGINNVGLVCGSYVDNVLARRHGFIGRIR